MRSLYGTRIGLLRLFRGTSEAEKRRRSRAGLVATILFVPVLLGVMGCFELPAPIGDPERSRIEPGISGVWIDDESDTDVQVLIFEPFDRRTWLLRWIVLDIDSRDDQSNLEALRAGGAETEGVMLFKVWRKRISGKSFFTMEFRGLLSSESEMEPHVWWGARMAVDDTGKLLLHMIDKDFAEFEEGMTRRQLERVIRRNHGNPGLFAASDIVGLTRVPVSDYDVIADLLDEFGLFSSY
jgi:hypothetical protein